jgi:rod shape-determining protein MreC
MFSKRMMVILGVIVLIAVSVIILSINSKRSYTSYGMGGVALTLVAPFQEIVTDAIRFSRSIWRHYFNLVTTSQENERLDRDLRQALEYKHRQNEIELSNFRLRQLLGFRETVTQKFVAAEVIGKDPSPWFKTIVIDKGLQDGVAKGMPVVMPEGIVGLVTNAAHHYATVLLLIDQNSAIDALVQDTRARGIVEGEPAGRCRLKYVLRKYDVAEGEIVIASGLDGVFPKGFRIGYISEVTKPNAGIFQEVTVTPYVDFEKLEEVLIVLDRPVKNAEPKP